MNDPAAVDKRGVAGSQGDWRKASFETLADDALAAVGFLWSRRDIDRKRVGRFGVSQGGWIGPLAASRSRHVALVARVSGPGVTPAEQTLDQIEGETRLDGVPGPEVREALDLTRLAFRYGRTGTGWDEYAAALARSQGRSWLPHLPLPPVPDDPARNGPATARASILDNMSCADYPSRRPLGADPESRGGNAAG